MIGAMRTPPTLHRYLGSLLVGILVPALFVTSCAKPAEDKREGMKRAAAPSPAPAAVPAWTPGLGELMSLQQMRHVKLWFAGEAGN